MIREQMLWAINEGVKGFFEASFAGGQQPLDVVTGYPLTPENSRVRFTYAYPYENIADAFIKHAGWQEDDTLTMHQLQDWARYCWQYVRLELVEDFGVIPPVSEWVFEKTHAEMEALGYERTRN